MNKWIVCLAIINLSFTQGLVPHDFYNSIIDRDDVVILDVRTWEDYASNRIINSIWAGELSELEKVVQNLNTKCAVFLYCDYDKRSSVVSNILKKKGFKQIYTLKGGLVDWKNMGFPLDTITFADSLKYNEVYYER